LAIDPHDVFSLNNKGVALYDLGKYHDAILSYDKVLALNPHDVDAKNNRANAVAKLACMTGNTTACYTGGTNIQKPAQPSQPDLLISFGKALFQ
jgi:tetratricopeptide (TPR) repeat protein